MEKRINDYAAAAKLIRQWLKAQGIQGNVRSEGYSMGSSVNVVIYDQNPEVRAKVEAYAKQYQYGHFNGMEDIYEYSNSRKDIPQAKFVFVRNELSDALKQEIWNFARNYYDLNDAPVEYAKAGNYRVEDWNIWGSDLVYRLAQGGFNQNEFWDNKAVAAQAAEYIAKAA